MLQARERVRNRRIRTARVFAQVLEFLESRILCSNSPLKLGAERRARVHHESKKPAIAVAPLADAAPSGPAPGGASPSVVGRYVYYGGTSYWGDFLAGDKSVLLPTQTAAFANVTSYTDGINELALDVANAATGYSAADFVCRAGLSGDPYSWSPAPAPSSVTVTAGAGSGGSTRVVIRWADGAIANEWLQVNFTPLGDTFYVGNLVGDTDNLQVNAADEAAARNHCTTMLAPATAANPCDFNRDGKVDAIDQLVARAAAGDALPALTAPAISVPTQTYDWHMQTINGALNIWAPNPGDFGSTFTVTDPTMLFGADGIPQIEGVHQGPIADCYFLSASGALAWSNPGRLESLIQNDAGGGWSVTFQYWSNQTFNYVPVVIHTSDQLSTSMQVVSHNEVWPLVLEKAYAAFRTWDGTSSQNTLATLGWGYAGNALTALNDPYQSLYIGAMSEQAVYSTLQTDLAAGQPVLFHTSTTAPTMAQSHVYVITAVSTDTQGVRWVTTYNPWGFYDTRTESDLLQNSVGSLVIGAH